MHRRCGIVVPMRPVTSRWWEARPRPRRLALQTMLLMPFSSLVVFFDWDHFLFACLAIWKVEASLQISGLAFVVWTIVVDRAECAAVVLVVRVAYSWNWISIDGEYCLVVFILCKSCLFVCFQIGAIHGQTWHLINLDSSLHGCHEIQSWKK